MKKVVSLLLVILILAVCFSAYAQNPISQSVTVEGSIFGGLADDKIAAQITFDTKWLTENDNRTYQPELAQFCALLSADSYFREKDYAKQRQNRVLFNASNEADYDFTMFLRNLGFEQVEHYESYLVQESPIDTNDSVTLTIGHQVVDEKYDVYALVIRGCFSAQEWCSAFDPGCAGEAYTEMTGEHPDWTEAEHFKGTDIAANRALSYVEAFMRQNGSDSLPDRILITGHSRGGGVANLLGAYFEKMEGVTPYTYTFNTPGVTVSADVRNYETIFNIYDTNDLLVDLFPFANDAFERYGKDLSVSISESEEIKNTIADLKGRNDYTCISVETAEQYHTLFALRFPSREMLYDQETVSRTYETKEKAEEARNECLTFISSDAGLRLEEFCKVGEIVQENDGSFSFTLTYCGAALLRTNAMILSYGDTAYNAAASLFAEDELGVEIGLLLAENTAVINSGHLLANSYVIAGNF